MPSGPRIRDNGILGTTTDNPLTAGAGTFNSAGLANLEIVAAAHKEAQEIIEKAKREVAAIHESLSGNIRKEAVGLAASMARRLIAGILSPADQHKLIAKHLTDLGKVKGI